MERAIATVHAMASARGYVYDAASQLDTPTRLVFRTQADGAPVLVALEDKLTLSVSKTCAAQSDHLGAARLIVVFGASPMSAARATLAEHAGLDRPIEFFTYAELAFDIMRHSLVPKFDVLSTDEIASMLHRYRVKQAQLPRMHSTDPCARYLGLSRGQVVRVTRSSAEYGDSVAYRTVT
jgi:DNA-directed RNA polymerase I, II, and III subunit RPABC1